MISVTEAKKLINENINPLKPVIKKLNEAAQHVLSKDVFGAFNIPSFRQSSMDGYAIIFGDKEKELELIGEMAAGTSTQLVIHQGQASRIFTGAPLPQGADTVVMQEKTVLTGNKLSFDDENLIPGSNVREIGSEISRGKMAMRKGDLLRPAALAFLAGIGISEVEVYPMPRVSVILTGNEFQQPGLPLEFGQVYESNSYSLSAALIKEGVRDIEIRTAEDNLETLTKVLSLALENSDLILLTGGVSVGDYDFVLEASGLCGITEIFHKVKQKPGKPLFFGKKDDQLIFGLPGNPSSVLSCFYNYVLPAINALSKKDNSVKEFYAELAESYQKPTGLTHFLKGNFHLGIATPSGAQESYRLSTFAQANCLIELTEDQTQFEKGETIKVLLLPD